MSRIVLSLLGLCLILPCLSHNTLGRIAPRPTQPRLAAAATEPEPLNLRDFGAVGDGVADDGPAFQRALDALATAGGGTLFVPEGQYSINTPVIKDFEGSVASITIAGVESLTPVAPPSASGYELSKGLDLLSEIYPRTGAEQIAIAIVGVRKLVVKDIAFVGTPTVTTDAAVTLYMRDIEKAQIKHSEFYGLATLVPGAGIVEAIRSDLEITQSKFLGTITTSGWYVPVVENIEWRGITITDTTFLDYGQRPFFGKSYLAPPISWINIGNAAAVDNLSPRREVVLRNVFLDEGGYWGLSSLPYRYGSTAPIDLIYVTGLHMNVSNFNQFGHQLYDAQRVFIEKSHYGWSQNAIAAIALRNIGSGILDQLTCVADADHIYADSNTRELTVINSTYAQLDSFAQKTNTINTTDENDPVQHVRRRFDATIGHEPDAAAHFYWSDLLIQCSDDSTCQSAVKAALDDYLSNSPSATFAISGHITDAHSKSLADVPVSLSGSQSVSTKTDANGNYLFKNLPTSGRYVITPTSDKYAFIPPSITITTPSGDRTANFTTELETHVVSGTITSGGNPLSNVVVSLSGAATGTAVTDNAGKYSFKLHAGQDYVLTPTKAHYNFDPQSKTITDLSEAQVVDFSGMLSKHSISGRVVNASGDAIAGVVMTLSGSVNRTATTAADGSYSFSDLDGGTNCTVTAAKDGYLLAPLVQTFNELGADTVADFDATKLPRLLTLPDSDRAASLELTQLVPEPFSLTAELTWNGRNRTRVIVFATDLGLLPGEGIEAVTAEAEDASHVLRALRVEFISPLPEFPELTQIVLRLNDEMNQAGDAMITVAVHGRSSNRVRIAMSP